ncbi:MAG: ribonuclease P protein component [Sphingobacteriales bacterium]|nr:ribonuclease P protein component [Sphingobacteriales bacterium]
MKHTLGKSERLSKKVLIDALFTKQCPAFLLHGFRFSFQFVESPQESFCSVLFVSSKKKLKTAAERNRRKRLLKELYRLNKTPLIQYLAEQQTPITLSINWVSAEDLNFHTHQPFFVKAIQRLISELQKNPKPAAHLAH